MYFNVSIFIIDSIIYCIDFILNYTVYFSYPVSHPTYRVINNAYRNPWRRWLRSGNLYASLLEEIKIIVFNSYTYNL